MGYVFLSVKSAEGRRHPDNVKIAEQEYEEAKAKLLKQINH